MKIRILNTSDSALEAWNISRPEANETDSSKIYNLDLPVAEFVRFDLEITSSIFVRELFCSLRDHVVWAQTSRVQNVLKFEMVDELKGYPSFDNVRLDMQKAADNGVRQDEYRLTLPMFSETTYCISISLRHLVNIAANLDYISTMCDDNVISGILSNDAVNVRETFSHIRVRDHKRKLILNEEFIDESNSNNGVFTTVTAEIPLYLRAQLVRHRQLLFVDNLFSIVTSRQAKYMSISGICTIQVVGSEEFLTSMVSKRSCWVAQHGIWSNFLSKIKSYMPIALPCDDGDCPFKKDVMLRVEGKDPNAPCPIFLNMAEMKVTEVGKEAIMNQYSKDGRPEFWENEIEKVEIL